LSFFTQIHDLDQLENCLIEIIGDMGAWYDIEVRGIVGSEPEGQKSITILNREVRWEPGKVSLEADPMHARGIVQDMGLEVGPKGLETPMTKDRNDEPDEADEEIGAAEATRFRGIAARANYLGIDWVDVQYAVKEIFRSMAKPQVSSWGGLKRLARYVLEYPRVVCEFCDVGEGDSYWAGCRSSRRSTSGGMLMVGRCCDEIVEQRTGVDCFVRRGS
jgi:hypothetical protein